MPGSSVGEVSLDLVLNQEDISRQAARAGQEAGRSASGPLTQSISPAIKKIGKMFAAAFAVKKLVDFGKEALELGSNLSEVQNVVDVTFSSMSDKVNAFAREAASSYGLSETMAKQFTGTFGAMAKAFGFTEGQALEMSTTLAGLAGDVASFYNLDQDAAYTKLKSVFSGETESLKDLGIVMTQTALDDYAMRNGFGKTTQKMSEQEKVALRYRFVLDQLSAASGDFARTSDSWANQTRILSLQMESFKATIGQGLINVFTPVIKVINTLMGKLISLADAFRSFTEMIIGKKADAGGIAAAAEGIGGVADSLGTAADAADTAASNTSGIGDAAKKAAKEMRSLMGFDQINKAEEQESAEASASSGKGGGAAGISGAVGAMNFGSLAKGDTVVDELSGSIDKLIKKAKQLAKLFKKGFKIGFGDSEKKIEDIRKNLIGIGTSLQEIFTDPRVTSSMDSFLNSIANSAGKITGSVVSIGLTLGQNLVGGIARYLDGSKDFIAERLKGIFDAKTSITDMFGDVAVAIQNVFSAWGEGSGQSITASILGVFSDAFLTVTELANKEFSDIVGIIIGPFVANQDKFRQAFDNFLKPISIVLDTVHTAVQDVLGKIVALYDEHVSPFFNNIREGLTEIVDHLLEGYNTYIAPVVARLALKVSSLWDGHIKPFFDDLCDFFATVVDDANNLWVNTLQPFIDWVVQHIGPVLAPILQTIGNVAVAFLGGAADAFDGLLKAAKGVYDFVVGLFSGDWDRTMKGMEEVASGLQQSLGATFGFIQDNILGPFKTWLKDTFGIDIDAVGEGIKTTFSGVGEFLKGIFTGDWDTAFEGLKKTAQGFRTTIGSIFTNVKNVVLDKFGGWLKDTFGIDFQAVFTDLKSGLDSFLEKVTSIKNSVTGVFDNLMDFIKSTFQTGWETAWNAVVNTFGNVFENIKEKAKTPFNAVIDLINTLIGKLEGALNWIIGGMNSISFTMPSWSPVAPGQTFGISIPYVDWDRVAPLAQGGYVKPNTPQLALIGDNRHQGEVVAPEDKLQQMAMAAAKAAGSDNTELVRLLSQILSVLGGMPVVTVDPEAMRRYFIRETNRNTKMTGVSELVI